MNGSEDQDVSEEMMTTKEAAEYVGMSVRAFREHLYNQKDVQKDDQYHGANRYSRHTLEKFRAARRPRGRPKTKDAERG